MTKLWTISKKTVKYMQKKQNVKERDTSFGNDFLLSDFYTCINEFPFTSRNAINKKTNEMLLMDWQVQILYLHFIALSFVHSTLYFDFLMYKINAST
jgi:hypothetical protein